MPEILTITFNPCIDKSTSVSSLAPEKKLHCTVPTFEPGGGGINVARAIKKLGSDAIAVYPSGGYSGKFLDTLLQQEGIVTRVVEAKKHTRENMIVMDRSTNLQYRFGMPGEDLAGDECEKCLDFIRENDAKFIVASGSLPPGVPKDIFARISKIAKKKNTKFIVDSSEEALKLVLEEGVYLIKPNIHELCKLAGKEELIAGEIEMVAKELIGKTKCEIIVVSMGVSGAILVTKDIVHKVSSPIVKIKSTVGAGDSMVAGIVLSLAKGSNLKDALEYGVACGTAATMSPGTQLCNPADVNKLLNIMRAGQN
jgi:6-phosphofructokinase 2